MSTIQSPTLTADEYAEKLFQSSVAFIDVIAAYLGDRLGWYRALASGPATPEELVARAGGSARYAREWLEQQATSGVLSVDPDGRFRLAEGPAEVLTEENVRAVFGLDNRVIEDPVSGRPLVLPIGRHHVILERQGERGGCVT